MTRKKRDKVCLDNWHFGKFCIEEGEVITTATKHGFIILESNQSKGQVTYFDTESKKTKTSTMNQFEEYLDEFAYLQRRGKLKDRAFQKLKKAPNAKKFEIFRKFPKIPVEEF